jgi:hypothetical protein
MICRFFSRRYIDPSESILTPENSGSRKFLDIPIRFSLLLRMVLIFVAKATMPCTVPQGPNLSEWA